MSPAPNVTQGFRDAAFAESTDEAVLVLLTLSHASFPTVRLVNNPEAVTSRGNVFSPFPFLVTPHREDGDSFSGATLQIDNVSRELIAEIRGLTSPADVVMELVIASEPDTVQRGPWRFVISRVSYDALVISAELGVELVLDEPYPGDRYDPAHFPGLY